MLNESKVSAEMALAGRLALEEQRDQAQRTAASQGTELAKANQASQQLVALREQVSGLQRRLQGREYAIQEQANLVEVQEKWRA